MGGRTGSAMTSYWTEIRLARLMARYRTQYWPRSRRLTRYRIQLATLDCLGQCDYEQRALLLDIKRHSSDRDVRVTVLHEMAHVVAGRTGHGSRFWEQIEHLLQRGAPITVSFPELGEHGFQYPVIPRRFRLARRRFRDSASYRRYLRQFRGRQIISETPAVWEDRFEDYGQDVATTWKVCWRYEARQAGLVDLDGRIGTVGRQYLNAARRGWRRGRAVAREDARTLANGRDA